MNGPPVAIECPHCRGLVHPPPPEEWMKAPQVVVVEWRPDPNGYELAVHVGDGRASQRLAASIGRDGVYAAMPQIADLITGLAALALRRHREKNA